MNKETVADEMFRNKIETDAKVNQIENETKILEATSKQESIIRRDKNSEREDNAHTDRVVTEETAKARIANSDANTHEELNKCDVDDRRNEVEHKKKKNDLEIQAKIQEINEKARKEVKVFVASNPEELEEERTALSALVAQINKILAPRNTNIIIKHSSEIEILSEVKDELKASDMCVVLFCEELDISSKEEMDEGFQEVKQTNNLKRVHVYFKETDTASEDIKALKKDFTSKYGQLFCKFVNIDSLKLNFVMQLEEVQSKIHSNLVKVQDSKVEFGGVPVADFKNIPFACNNEEYNLLFKSIKKTQKLLAITDVADEDYAEYAAELQNLKEKLAKMEASLWDTALMITRLSTTKCSERLKRAMDLFSAGDNKGAQAVLNEEEIEKDVEHNLHLIQLGEDGKKGLMTNIEEYRLKIKTLGNEMADGWLQEQSKLHERIIELTVALYGEHSLEVANAMMEAGETIQLLGNPSKLYEYAKTALEICYDILGEKHLDTAQCYNDFGVAAGMLGNYDEFLEFSNKGLEIRLNLNANDTLLAESYDCVGAALSLSGGDKTKYLENALKALELRKKVYGEMHMVTASSYSEVGCAYGGLQDEEKSLEYNTRALEIALALVGDKHPDTGRFHNNVANAYIFLEKYPEAIEHLTQALKINISTTGKYTSGTMLVFDNLAFVYEKNQELEKSLDAIMEAIDISEKINGETHSTTLNLIERAGNSLDKYGDRKSALNYLYHALDIRFRIAEEEQLQNGPLPTFDLANLCHRIGTVHFYMRDYESAERMINNAINIISDLNENHPALCEWTAHLGMVYEQLKKYDKALKIYKTSLELLQLNKFTEHEYIDTLRNKIKELSKNK